MAAKRWGPTRKEKDAHRRKLLLRARKGELKAQDELMEKYGMRVYSDTERSKMPIYYDSGKKGSPPSITKTKTTTGPKQSPKGLQRLGNHCGRAAIAIRGVPRPTNEE